MGILEEDELGDDGELMVGRTDGADWKLRRPIGDVELEFPVHCRGIY